VSWAYIYLPAWAAALPFRGLLSHVPPDLAPAAGPEARRSEPSQKSTWSQWRTDEGGLLLRAGVLPRGQGRLPLKGGVELLAPTALAPLQSPERLVWSLSLLSPLHYFRCSFGEKSVLPKSHFMNDHP